MSDNFLKILLLAANKYESSEEKFSHGEKSKLVFQSILKELKKKKLSLKIVSSFSEGLLKEEELSDRVIQWEPVEYAWQKPKVTANAVFSIVPNYDNPVDDTPIFLLGAFAKEGLVSFATEYSMFEIIVFNKQLMNLVTLKQSFIKNIEMIREHFLGNPKISLHRNIFNKFKRKTLGLNVHVVEYDHNEILAILDVFFKKTDLFYGIVPWNIALWIAMTCVAAGVKCELKQIYLEDATRKEQNIHTSPTIERSLAEKTAINKYHWKIYTETDICKSIDVHAFIIPLDTNDGILNKNDSKHLTYVQCYDKQIFKIQK